ncbi:type VII secretion integral membrane protein EccD [Asanoa ishikariensis]|uniref:Type VII secretion integral membrane protein EccD n=1 Tax=Asanoa ishikariensis TaxID=137265 RepID=A0A1H3KSL8_9ACTN|nr:type VII secretion integral membrane protein EccD [Asanoa ishikariensis]GIF69716.1 type VII secretion integral membrane protein EccD [Asanoa ishikariensis]SDY55177.1 type VII secretion integral membrane protein EccD [Asanoa ishikariensis]
MAGATTAGSSRVTIVAPKTRVDLALPSEVPLADVLPTVLRFAGDRLADEPDGRYGWSLARLAGPALDIAQSPAQLEIRDGELLYLRPRGGEQPEPVFDDVVDAIATATRMRPGRWSTATTKVFGLGLGAAALVGGAVALALIGPPRGVAPAVALVLALLLLATSAVAARGFGDHRNGLLLAIVSMVYAAVGGLTLFAGSRGLADLGAPDLLVCAAAVVFVSAVAGSAAVAAYGQIFLAASAGAVGLGVAAVICMIFGATPAGAASIVLALALVFVPAMPMMSYRLAGLPVPTVPSGTEDLRTDTETVDGARVLRLAERADDLLAGMLGAVGLIAAGSALALVTSGGTAGYVLCAALGLLLFMRARWFISTAQRLPLLGAGVVAIGAIAVGGFLTTSVLGRLTLVVAGLLVVAAISVGAALGAGRRRSPLLGRTVDILEILLILGILPLVVWASGLYGWIRAIRES